MHRQGRVVGEEHGAGEYGAGEQSAEERTAVVIRIAAVATVALALTLEPELARGRVAPLVVLVVATAHELLTTLLV